jgi:hypothetical protein
VSSNNNVFREILEQYAAKDEMLLIDSKNLVKPKK